MRGEITVAWAADQKKWRAFANVPQALMNYPGINGGITAPPWSEGFGDTPEDALTTLITVAGRAALAAAEEDPCTSA